LQDGTTKGRESTYVEDQGLEDVARRNETEIGRYMEQTSTPEPKEEGGTKLLVPFGELREKKEQLKLAVRESQMKGIRKNSNHEKGAIRRQIRKHVSTYGTKRRIVA